MKKLLAACLISCGINTFADYTVTTEGLVDSKYNLASDNCRISVRVEGKNMGITSLQRRNGPHNWAIKAPKAKLVRIEVGNNIYSLRGNKAYMMRGKEFAAFAKNSKYVASVLYTLNKDGISIPKEAIVSTKKTKTKASELLFKCEAYSSDVTNNEL